MDKQTGQVENLAKMLGVFFLISGAVVLIVLLYSLGQFLTDPESIFSVGMFTEFLESDSSAVSVTIDGREAIVDIDPTIRIILVIFVGAMSIVALGSVLHACIGGGLALVKFANRKSGRGEP